MTQEIQGKDSRLNRSNLKISFNSLPSRMVSDSSLRKQWKLLEPIGVARCLIDQLLGKLTGPKGWCGFLFLEGLEVVSLEFFGVSLSG